MQSRGGSPVSDIKTHLLKADYTESLTYDKIKAIPVDAENVKKKAKKAEKDLYAKRACSSVQILVQLQRYMDLAIEFCEPGTWDNSNRDDILKILTFQINYFPTRLFDYERIGGDSSNDYGTYKSEAFGELTYPRLCKVLSMAREKAEKTLRELCERSQGHLTDVEKIRRIPAATFMELVVRTEVQRRHEDIFSAIGSETDDLEQKNATGQIILGIFQELRPNFGRDAIDKAEEEKKAAATNRGERYDNTSSPLYYWVPDIIVVVVDTERRVVLTAASKPSFVDDESAELSQLSRDINQARIGPDFSRLIDSLIASFYDRVNGQREGGLLPGKEEIPDLTDEEVIQLYHKVVSATECLEHDQISRPKKGEKIFCWAFNGRTLEPEAPCHKCQHLYSAWTMNQMPQSAAKKREVLEYLAAKRGVPDTVIESRRCYCAETVAAAKLWALDSKSARSQDATESAAQPDLALSE